MSSNNQTYSEYLKINTAEDIIIKLEPYITEQRQQRINQTLSSRIEDIHLAMESTADMHNALAAVRSSEALGIVHVHLISPEGDAKTVRRITKGAHNWLRIHFHDDINSFITYIKQQNIFLAGATVDATTPLGQINIEQPLCLLLGNEQRGLSKNAKQGCDLLYNIPMYGMTESFNLSVSAAISLYDCTQRKRALLQENNDIANENDINRCSGNLIQSTKNDLKARHYCHTLKKRLVDNLLRKLKRR